MVAWNILLFVADCWELRESKRLVVELVAVGFVVVELVAVVVGGEVAAVVGLVAMINAAGHSFVGIAVVPWDTFRLCNILDLWEQL